MVARPWRRSSVRIGVVALGVLAIIAAGCNTDDDADRSETPTTSVDAVDACALLGADAVAGVVGGPAVMAVGEPAVRDGVTVASCEWEREDGSGASVSLLVSHEAGQGNALDTAIEALRTEAYAGRVVEDVAVGDAGLWVADGPARQLSAFSGDNYLVLTLPVGTTRDAAVALATAALESLSATR